MKKAILIIGLALIVAMAVSACNGQTGATGQLKKYLKDSGYSCSNDVCTKESEKTEGDVTEAYTEKISFKEHTYTTVLAHENHANGTFWQREYIYDYAAGTVTMNQYGTAKSHADKKPDTVYFLTKAGMLDCTEGDPLDTEAELLNDMQRFKKVFEEQLKEAGIALENIIE